MHFRYQEREPKFGARGNKRSLTYPYQDQGAKPQSGTSYILQSPISRLKGHVYSLHLQNQDKESKFGTWVYQRPVTISDCPKNNVAKI